MAMRFAPLLALLSVATAALNVHIVPHTHDDVGWLKTVDQYFSGANNTIQHAGVRNIINEVVDALLKDPSRKFTYVEQAFFQMWWREQDAARRAQTVELVKSGRLNFVNGGWCMQDEAATHYVAMIDQTTLGHRYISEQFGPEAQPNVGWQLDPFGHSAVQAALLGAETGFDALFFGRIDYQDLDLRRKNKAAEFVWRASPSLGPDAQVFAGLTGEYDGNYGPPEGFDWAGNDEPVEDNPELDTYNLPSRVDDFVKAALRQASMTRGDHIMWTMGSDFNYGNAGQWFTNLDKIIKGVNADGRVRVFYSSPSEYTAAKLAEIGAGLEFPLLAGDNADFFPYADGPHQFWTGYFTSRPTLKRYVRTASALLNAVRQLQALAATQRSELAGPARLITLEEQISVAQHHDGVSGTSKQHVAFDYARRIARGQLQAEFLQSTAVNVLLGTDTAWTACRRLNETVCDVSLGSSEFSVLLFNPLAQARTETLRVPVRGASVTVVDAVTGETVQSQVVPAVETVSQYQRNTNEARYVAVFQATVQPLASALFNFVAREAEAEPVKRSQQLQSADIVLENEFVSLTFNSSGRLASMTNKATSTRVAVSQQFCYYKSSTGDRASGQKSGAYIFRPITNECFPIQRPDGSVVITDVTRGPLMQSITQTFDSWLTQTVRLAAGERFATFEYTVGDIPLVDAQANQTLQQCVSWRQTTNCDPNGPREPQNDKTCDAVVGGDSSGYCECFGGRKAALSGCGHSALTCRQACLFTVGKEVVSRFSTGIASAAELWTDSNGRDMLHRKRDHRPTWDLKQTEAVAGNYFPVNTAAYIRDSRAQFTLLVDSAQGVGSIQDGAVEAMVHRRVFEDDARGVGEPLNETEAVYSYTTRMGGMKFGNGLIVRGVHTVSLEPPATAADIWRPLVDRAFATMQPLFATGKVNAPSPSSFQSALAQPLPANVQVITLQSLAPKQVLLRIAHQFGLGESSTLSQPVKVNLSTLFRAERLRVLNATEVSLTNKESKESILRRRQAALTWASNGDKPHPWRSEGPVDFASNPVVTLGPLEIKTYVLDL